MLTIRFSCFSEPWLHEVEFTHQKHDRNNEDSGWFINWGESLLVNVKRLLRVQL